MQPGYNSGGGDVTYDDFKYSILQDYLKLADVVTPNKAELLCEHYRRPTSDDGGVGDVMIDIDRFIEDLKATEARLVDGGTRVKLFDRQADADEHTAKQAADQ